MASLRKHPKSRFLIACYTDHTGKQRQKSTKVTDKVAARRIAHGLELAYRRQLTDLQLRDAYSQISKELNGQSLNFDSGRKFFNDWLANKKVEKRESSFTKYEGVVGRFLTFLGTKADRDLMVISASDVSDYRNSVAQRLKPSTTNGHLKILRVAFEDAMRDGKIPINPAKQVRTIQKTGGSVRRPFTFDEINRLLRVANEEWRGLILAGVCTGQRLGDIARLRWSNVNSDTRILSLKSQKTQKPVTVYMLDQFWDHLMSLTVSDDPTAPLFPKAFEAVEQAGSVHPLSKGFHALLVSAGLAEEWESKKTGTGRSVARDNTGLSFHAFRHSAVTLLKQSGVPETVVMAIVGHSSRAVSDQYTHMDEATITRWMKNAANSYAKLETTPKTEQKPIRIGTQTAMMNLPVRKSSEA